MYAAGLLMLFGRTSRISATPDGLTGGQDVAELPWPLWRVWLPRISRIKVTEFIKDRPETQ